MSEPINQDPTQPITAPDPGVDTGSITTTRFKEAGPVSIDTVPNSAPERPVGEFIVPSNSELQPSPDLAGVVKPTYVAQPPQAAIDAAAAQIPPDPVQAARVDLPNAHAIADKGDIKSSNTWIGAMREFFDKRIIAMFVRKKTQPSNI